MFFFKERNLARNQSTHMLITCSMTKKETKTPSISQPLGSQCLLPLINFLELSLSRYHKTWLICQPRRHCQHLLQGELVVLGPVPHEEVGHRGAQSKLRLPHSALSCDILAASAPRREAVSQKAGQCTQQHKPPCLVFPKSKTKRLYSIGFRYYSNEHSGHVFSTNLFLPTSLAALAQCLCLHTNIPNKILEDCPAASSTQGPSLSPITKPGSSPPRPHWWGL